METKAASTRKEASHRPMSTTSLPDRHSTWLNAFTQAMCLSLIVTNLSKRFSKRLLFTIADTVTDTLYVLL